MGKARQTGVGGKRCLAVAEGSGGGHLVGKARQASTRCSGKVHCTTPSISDWLIEAPAGWERRTTIECMRKQQGRAVPGLRKSQRAKASPESPSGLYMEL